MYVTFLFKIWLGIKELDSEVQMDSRPCQTIAANGSVTCQYQLSQCTEITQMQGKVKIHFVLGDMA